MRFGAVSFGPEAGTMYPWSAAAAENAKCCGNARVVVNPSLRWDKPSGGGHGRIVHSLPYKIPRWHVSRQSDGVVFFCPAPGWDERRPAVCVSSSCRRRYSFTAISFLAASAGRRDEFRSGHRCSAAIPCRSARWVQGIPPGGGRDSARLIRFCGLTRIMPWRGESMSAMSMNAMETISGRIGSNLDPALALREP